MILNISYSCILIEIAYVMIDVVEKVVLGCDLCLIVLGNVIAEHSLCWIWWFNHRIITVF